MKTLLSFIPAHILLFYGFGVVFRFYSSINIPTFLLVGLGVLLFGFCYMKKHEGFAFCILLFLLGVFSIQSRLTNSNAKVENRHIYIYTIATVLKSNNYYAFIENSKETLFREKVLLYFKNRNLEDSFLIGDRIITHSKPYVINTKANPYSFDYKKYLSEKNIYRKVYLQQGSWRKLKTFSSSIKRRAFLYRRYLIESLRTNISNKDALSVMVALLLGERQLISSDLKSSYADAGVIHILAVSGLHIGIIVMMLHFLLKPLHHVRHGKSITFGCIFLFLWSYAFLAGLSASVIRSVTMFSFVSFGWMLNKKTNVYYSIVTSALILVLINPFYFFDLGFKMSYIAVFSIVTIYPFVLNFWRPKNIIIKYFWELSAVSISAQIGLLPLTLYYFHQFPGLFILSNLIIIPCLGLLLMFGFFVLFLSAIEIDCDLCFEGYSFFIEFLNKFIVFVSKQDKWVLDSLFFNTSMLILSYIIIVLMIYLLDKISLRKIYLFGLGIVSMQLVFVFAFFMEKDKEELIVYNFYKKSVISIALNSKVSFYGAVSSSKDRIVQNYISQSNLKLDTIINEVPSVLNFKGNYVLVLDSKGAYGVTNFRPEIMIITNSPKVNLERCIQKLNPSIVIADGSNYPSFKKRWSATCKKLNIRFYDVSKQNAFQLQ